MEQKIEDLEKKIIKDLKNNIYMYLFCSLYFSAFGFFCEIPLVLFSAAAGMLAVSLVFYFWLRKTKKEIDAFKKESDDLRKEFKNA